MQMNAIAEIVNDWQRWIIFPLCSTLLITGCNGYASKEVNAGKYLAYIGNEKNGFIQRKAIDGIVFEVRYLSPEAMALTELEDLNPEKQKLARVIREYGQMAYFRVDVGAKQGHLFNELLALGKNPDDLESYLNFDAEHDFTLYTSTDTVKCGLYHFNRTYGLSKGWQLMLAFDVPNREKQSDWIVSYEDQIANSGQLNFRFAGTDIANIPKLTY